MGNVLTAATQKFLEENTAFGRFRRALRKADQVILDDLLANASPHLAMADYASHALPIEVLLLALGWKSIRNYLG
jgi:hypothetical protein